MCIRDRPKDGKPYLIRANDVILATGGYSAGKELLKQYTPEVLNLGTTNRPERQYSVCLVLHQILRQSHDIHQVTVYSAQYDP